MTTNDERITLYRDPIYPGYATDAYGGHWSTYAVTSADEQVLQRCGRCGRDVPWAWRHTNLTLICGDCVTVVPR